MSRNTHALALPDNAQITPPFYDGSHGTEQERPGTEREREGSPRRKDRTMMRRTFHLLVTPRDSGGRGPQATIRILLDLRNAHRRERRIGSHRVPHGPRGRDPKASGARTNQRAGRPDSLDKCEHRKETLTAHQHQAWSLRPRASGRVGHRTRPARRAKGRLSCDLLPLPAPLGEPLGPGPCGPPGSLMVDQEVHENGPVGRWART
jgi:hypothetical protein